MSSASVKQKVIVAPIEQEERVAVPLAHQAIHDTVIKILRELPKGSLLDAPTGEGALAARLLDEGFDVRCSDLYPEIFCLHNVEIKRGNLSGALPFGDESFNYITCIEGLEHIENPHQAMREFKRILRVGGHIIISIPNILNIEERVKWLLFGYTSHFKPLSSERLDEIKTDFGSREEIALHINPLGYSELRYLLEKNGFEIVRLYRDKAKAKIWMYSPLVFLIRMICRLFISEQKRKERWIDGLISDEVLLGGNTLIVHAVKIDRTEHL
jgi:ubiquinone/menaquinone biosynthesis C-methylase UbiE